jgi:N-methylhydantoinase B
LVDFAGTAAQAPTPINAALSSARAGVFTAIIALVDPAIPVNAGVFDLIDLEAPEACIVNARWPAPVYGCTFELAKRIPETILKAFANRIPERVAAGSHGSGNNIAGRFIDPRTDEESAWYNY